MTPLNRRAFLARLLGLATLPFAARALGKAASTPSSADMLAASVEPIKRDYLVQGIGIKVPSNRYLTVWNDDGSALVPRHFTYAGDWRGTFKVEPGCSNPAYILADLYERTGAEPDWVVERQMPVPSSLVLTGLKQMLTPAARLDWQMLYDWGRHSDELTSQWDHLEAIGKGSSHCRIGYKGLLPLKPRFVVNAVVHTHEDMVALREHLRMRCLQWQSSDPRYQRSFPGIPHPLAHRTALGVYV